MTRFPLAVYTLSLVLFGLISYLAHQVRDFPGDRVIALWLQGVDLPFLTPSMQIVSYIASLVPATVMVALISLGLWFSGRKREPIFIISLTSLATVMNWLLKLLLARPRPGGEINFLEQGDSFSFPSGHIVYATVFYGFLFYLTPRLINQSGVAKVLQSLLILLILFTGISRIYLGAHYFSDVLGSLLLGSLLLVPATRLYHNYTKGKQRKRKEENA